MVSERRHVLPILFKIKGTQEGQEYNFKVLEESKILVEPIGFHQKMRIDSGYESNISDCEFCKSLIVLVNIIFKMFSRVLKTFSSFQKCEYLRKSTY